MSIESTPADDLQDWRDRTSAFLRDQRRAFSEQRPIEIDVDDMIGAKGHRLDALNEALGSGDLEEGWSHNSLAVTEGAVNDGEPFPALQEEAFGHEGLVEQMQPLLGRLAAHRAEQALEPIGRAMHELREPIRTVTINHLFLNETAERTARRLGTSIETVEFLADVALDLLSSHISFD